MLPWESHNLITRSITSTSTSISLLTLEKPKTLLYLILLSKEERLTNTQNFMLDLMLIVETLSTPL